MNKTIKILIPTITAIIILGGFARVTFAQPATSRIQFETAPLFGETSFAPGNSVTRWVKLNNDTALPHQAVVRAVNVVNSGDFKLGDAVRLVIKEGATIWYEGTFSNFFSKSEVLLDNIPAGQEKTYDFVVTFNSNAGNEYQNSTMGFNLQIGFEELETTTDTTTTISGEIGGGGGGSTSGPRHLVISGENAANQAPDDSDTVVATWSTNIPATSQVVYGPVNSGPYSIDMSLNNFGYPTGTPEQDLTKVINHSVIISGLAPGTYVYRVVSRASPPTVSYEHQFTVTKNVGTLGIADGAGEAYANANSPASGNNENATTSEVVGEIAGAADQNNLASVFTTGFNNNWWIWVLLLILVSCLSWFFILKL